MEEVKKRGRPRVNSEGQRQLDKAQEEFDKFDAEVKEMTLDRMNMAPKKEIESQSRISQSDLSKSKDIYLKPKRSYTPGVNPKTGEREKFNEKFRKDYEFQREYVHFTAQNNMIIGESIELTVKKFPGTPIEDWVIPVGKPVWAPRMVAERIKNCTYHEMTMENRSTGGDGQGNQYYGALTVQHTVQRLDAHPVNDNRSVFMGESQFKSKVV